MKALKLLALLARIIAEHGDVDVYIVSSHTAQLFAVKSIQFHTKVIDAAVIEPKV